MFFLKAIKNNQGSAIVMGLGMIVMASSMVLAVSMMADKESSQRAGQREGLVIREIHNNLQILLTDPRFCSDFFSNGFATNATTINFTPNAIGTAGGSQYVKRSREIIKEYQDKFKTQGFEVRSVELSTPTVTPVAGQGKESMKFFDISVNIEKVSDTKNKGIYKFVKFGKTGINRENPFEHLTVGFNQLTGGCSVYRKNALQSATVGMRALTDSCSSLGGKINPTTLICELPRFQFLEPAKYQEGVLDYGNKQATSGYDFSDALCEMEKNILRKNRETNLANQLRTNPSTHHMNWTNFCKKPEWGGCFYNNTYFVQGQTHVRTHGMKAKQIKRFIGDRQEEATGRRVARLYMIPPQKVDVVEDFQIAERTELTKQIRIINKITGGAIGSAFGEGVDEATANTIVAVGAMTAAVFSAGPAAIVVAILIALLPKCDKGRVHVTRTCLDGMMEPSGFAYQTQRMKRFRCKWRGPKKVGVSDDAQIVQAINAQAGVNKPIKPYDPKILDSGYIKSPISDKQMEADIIKEIKAAASLRQLIEEPDEYDIEDPEEITDPNILKVFKDKEAQLLASNQTKINNLVNDIATVSSATTIDSATKAKLLSTVNAMLLELKDYNAYQKTVSPEVDTAKVQQQFNQLMQLRNQINSLNTSNIANL